MAQSIKVEITPDLVERATKRDSQHCMIAEAIKRKDGGDRYTQIYVDLQTIRWSDKKTGKRYTALTPQQSAGAALVAFDQGDPIEPFSFVAKVIKVTTAKTRTRAGKWHTRDQMVIDGPELPKAHLRGTATHGRDAGRRKAGSKSAQATRELARLRAEGGASNVELSKQAFRMYGLRLLKA